MTQNTHARERSYSSSRKERNVNRVKAIKIRKCHDNANPSDDYESIKKARFSKEDSKVDSLSVFDQKSDIYPHFLDNERYAIYLFSAGEDNKEILDNKNAEDNYDVNSGDSDRGRRSSQSSQTVVEDGEYEKPITRSTSNKPISSPIVSIKTLSEDGPESRGISGDTQVGRNTSSSASTVSIKRKSNATATDNASRANHTTNKRTTTTTSTSTAEARKSKPTHQKSRRVSHPSLCLYESIFPVCDQHGTKKKNKSVCVKGRLCSKDIRMVDKSLGEGQIGKVFVAYYRGLPVACKTKRRKVSLDNYENQVLRELTFAAKLSACKYMNRYVGWFNCPDEKTQEEDTNDSSTEPSICIVQRYIPNGDSRKYLYQRVDSFKPFEVLQATICLFTALKDAHSLNIGIVDLKLENFLIDSAGTGWITDFGSCVEFHDAEVVRLDDMEVTWTTHVASPEMIAQREFRKASDVFMATLIAAELMTGDLTDEAFQDQVLRREPGGRVNLSCDSLNTKFQAFFTILQAGLRNEPEDRPTAQEILEKLLLIRDALRA